MIGVVGLLIALVLPAVQRARDAARRAHCANNLRQLGIATQSYLTANGVLPLLVHYLGDHFPPRSGVYFPKRYSVFSSMLPFLEQGPLFHSINFDVALDDSYIERALQPPPPGSQGNSTAIATYLGVLCCPADGGGPQIPGRLNYRANAGPERWWFADDSPFANHLRPCSAADMTDGFSQTVAFSEKLIGRPTATRPDPRTDMIYGGLALPFSAEDSYRRCAAPLGPPEGFIPSTGLTWLVDSLVHSRYNHIIEPNSTIPDCVLPGSLHGVAGLAGARSNHPGGVNAAMADSSVRFIANSIDRRTWKAIGTRSGGEAVMLD